MYYCLRQRVHWNPFNFSGTESKERGFWEKELGEKRTRIIERYSHFVNAKQMVTESMKKIQDD